MKRGRGDSLTGGTGDVSPQTFTQSITLSAANTFTQAETGLPMIRLPVKNNRSIVMELLRLRILHPLYDTNPAAGGTNAYSVFQLSTVSETLANPGDARVIAYSQYQWRGAFTAAGTFETVTNNTDDIDLTDGAGHGL